MSLPHGMRLRPADRSDLDAILRLEHAAFPRDAWSRAQMLDVLQSAYAYTIVAEPEPASAVGVPLVGYASLSSLPGDTTADVQTIAVDASARGTGIGGALFQALLTEAHRRRVHEVFLEVRADNPIAQHMYARFGFVHIATRPRYYQPDDVDAFVMRLPLDGGTAGPVGQEAINA